MWRCRCRSDIKSEDLSSEFTFDHVYPLVTGPVRCVQFQLCGEHVVLKTFRRIEFIVHIAISVLPGTRSHLSQRNNLMAPKDTTSKRCPKIKRGETLCFSGNLAPCGVRNSTTGSDIGKAPRSNHGSLSLWASSKKYFVDFCGILIGLKLAWNRIYPFLALLS